MQSHLTVLSTIIQYTQMSVITYVYKLNFHYEKQLKIQLLMLYKFQTIFGT